jgi:hypothetical protein
LQAGTSLAETVRRPSRGDVKSAVRR